MTLPLHGKRNTDHATEGTEMPPAPDVGSDIIILDSDGHHKFSGFMQSVDEENVVSLIVTTTRGTAAIILNDRSEFFRFGNPEVPFIAAQTALWYEAYSGLIPSKSKVG